MVNISLVVPHFHLDSHMIFAFTPENSAVPHFTLDSVANGDNYAFHLDLIPRVDLATSLPYLDTVWDVLHTVIRPVGGALIAVTSLGAASPAAAGLAALLGGAVATSSHLTKASTRAVANTSPEPFSNWTLSLAEDVFAFGLVSLALAYPVAALVVALVVLGCILVFSVVIVRLAARWLGTRWRSVAALH